MIEIDFDKIAQDALQIAQFGFKFKSLSSNEAYIPKGNNLFLTWAGASFKEKVMRILSKQKARLGWEKQNRYYSLWIILNPKYCRVDANNSAKLIQDAFVSAGIVPDDRYSLDSRQIYGDFSPIARIPADTHWAVLIRHGKEIR